MNRHTGEKISEEIDHIKQSIADILLTPIGSRIQRRDYGSQIPLLLARPISRTLLLQIASCAVMAITKWEPRIQITQFKPQLDLANGIITATLVARTTNTQNRMQINELILGKRQ